MYYNQSILRRLHTHTPYLLGFGPIGTNTFPQVRGHTLNISNLLLINLTHESKGLHEDNCKLFFSLNKIDTNAFLEKNGNQLQFRLSWNTWFEAICRAAGCLIIIFYCNSMDLLTKSFHLTYTSTQVVLLWLNTRI